MAGIHGANDIVTDGLVFAMDIANPRSFLLLENTLKDIYSNQNVTPGLSYISYSSLYDYSGLGHLNVSSNFHLITPLISGVKSVCIFMNTSQGFTSPSWCYLLDGRLSMPNSWFTSNNSNAGIGSSWSLLRIDGVSSPMSWGSIPLNKWFQFYVESSISPAATNLYILSRYTAQEWLKARIAQVLVYNRSLTQEEVIKNYNATKRRFGL